MSYTLLALIFFVIYWGLILWVYKDSQKLRARGARVNPGLAAIGIAIVSYIISLILSNTLIYIHYSTFLYGAIAPLLVLGFYLIFKQTRLKAIKGQTDLPPLPPPKKWTTVMFWILYSLGVGISLISLTIFFIFRDFGW